MAEIAARRRGGQAGRDAARRRRDGRPGGRRASPQAFAAAVPLTGLVLTKIDGDARGGAALSISAVTGVPVKFLGTGEKTDALEVFHPDRLAGRILGMGDVLTLVERAQEHVRRRSRPRRSRRSSARTSFTLEDLLDQMQQLKKMGPLGQVDGDDPGHGRHGQGSAGAPSTAATSSGPRRSSGR